MSANTILCCVIVVIINDYIYLYVNQLYYARALILTILYLLFDIFRIHHDYLLVSKELEVLQKHDKYILEEIRYNAILIKELQCSLEDIKINSNNILSYCKKINNLLNYSS
uniref:Uncharacterized protein n=1 Tax=viral metagenome TaxID=1070528 RepID=A0A6C0CDV2_9ZZZZ